MNVGLNPNCRYRLGKPGTAKVLLLFREGWAALPQFGLIDRAAILVVSASMVPYSPPIHPHVRAPPSSGVMWPKMMHLNVPAMKPMQLCQGAPAVIGRLKPLTRSQPNTCFSDSFGAS